MKKSLILYAALFTFVGLLGCAEGPLWQTGSYNPWVREKWEAEEQIADTLIKRKRSMTSMVQTAANSSTSIQENAVKQLSESIQRDPVLLIRIHAVELLGQLNTAEAASALKLASKDPDSRVRNAAINAWKSMPTSVAVGQLQEILGSDTDVDVRLNATEALGDLPVPEAAQALSLALSDTNPAVQLRATESLQQITGEQIGADVAAWQTYLGNSSSQQSATAGLGTSFR